MKRALVAIGLAALMVLASAPATAGENEFSRGVTIREPVHAHPGQLIRGQVSSDEFNCSAFQTVLIQRRRGGAWHSVGIDVTNETAGTARSSPIVMAGTGPWFGAASLATEPCAFVACPRWSFLPCLLDLLGHLPSFRHRLPFRGLKLLSP